MGIGFVIVKDYIEVMDGFIKLWSVFGIGIIIMFCLLVYFILDVVFLLSFLWLENSKFVYINVGFGDFDI